MANMCKKKGIYLCCGRARHFDYDIDYLDIDPRYGDIVADAANYDLCRYDYIIASPPCNWWSKANPYYKTSDYSLRTKYLLPLLLQRLAFSGKPFLLENVINKKRMSEEGIWQLTASLSLNYQFVGRHTYWTRDLIDLQCPQHQDFKYGGRRVNSDGHNQGGSNVHAVVDLWLKKVVV